jgi:hypothetical protein
MFEWYKEYKSDYESIRPNSTHYFGDARSYNLVDICPTSTVDYLQIDLCAEASFDVLKKIDLSKIEFSVITYEHDIWNTKNSETRDGSRDILERNGYHLVFGDVHTTEPKFVFEDWWVNPDRVDMSLIHEIKSMNNSMYVHNDLTNYSIGGREIKYPDLR